MRMLHDPAVQRDLETRLASLRPDSPRQWGTMSIDQMLWHLNQFLAGAMGEGTLPTVKSKMPAFIMRFFLIYMPWPKSAPTNKGAIAKGEHDFEAERAKLQALITRFVQKPLDSQWPDDPSFGPATGAFSSRLQAKHLDHHFRQFGA